MNRLNVDDKISTNKMSTAKMSTKKMSTDKMPTGINSTLKRVWQNVDGIKKKYNYEKLN